MARQLDINGRLYWILSDPEGAGWKAHVVHVSSSDALPMIASARRDGVRLTAESCPHYLALTAEEIGDGETAFKCSPPIREAANRELLWDGVARRGPRPGGLRPFAVHSGDEGAGHR